MDETSTESNQSSSVRPEVVVAIVFGILFGAVLVILSLIAFIFIMKYRNRRSLTEQGGPTGINSQCDVNGISYRESNTNSSVTSEPVNGYQTDSAVPKQTGESWARHNNSTLYESNVTLHGDSTEKSVNAIKVNQNKRNDALLANGLHNKTIPYGKYVQDRDMSAQESALQDSIVEGPRVHLRTRADHRLANSEKIGRSRKWYLERLFKRMRKNEPINKHGMSGDSEPGNQIGEEKSLEVQDYRIKDTFQSTSDDQTTLNDVVSREDEMNALDEGEHEQQTVKGSDAAIGSSASNPRVQSDDYMNKLLEQLRKSEMEKEKKDQPVRTRWSHRVKVDDEMLKFYQTSYDFLSKDRSEQERQEPSIHLFRSQQPSSRRRVEMLPSISSNDGNIEEEN